MNAVIQGAAHAVPSKILSNADLERLVDTNDDWIFQRTGMRERRICEEGETTVSLCIEAGKKIIQNLGIDPEEVEMIICATVTGDFPFPSASCLIQHGLGAKNAGAFDVGAACAGFVYAVSIATSLIKSGQVKNALVFGADALTKMVDWTDRSTCILFGDGAGVVYLTSSENGNRGVLETAFYSDGSGARFIDCEVGGNRYPVGASYSEGRRTKIFMAGNEVYRFAVHAIPECCQTVLKKAKLTVNEIDLFVPHQANLRIIESAAERLGMPMEKVMINIQNYGNTSAASVPIALSEAAESGRLQKGMTVLTVGFGAGLVWGANILRW